MEFEGESGHHDLCKPGCSVTARCHYQDAAAPKNKKSKNQNSKEKPPGPIVSSTADGQVCNDAYHDKINAQCRADDLPMSLACHDSLSEEVFLKVASSVFPNIDFTMND